VLAEILSWLVLTAIVICLIFPRAGLFDKALVLSIFFMPVLTPSVASDMFLRGSVFRVVAIMVPVSLIIYWNRPLRLPSIAPFSFYIIFIMVCLLSSIESIDPLESILRSLTYLEPFMFFLFAFSVAYNYDQGFEKINRWVLYATLLVVGYGIIQVVTQRDLLHEIGFTDPMSFIGGHVSYIADQRTFSGRITSFLAQPVFTAFFLIVILVVPLYKFLSGSRKALHLMLAVTIALLIYTTGTRSAYVVFVSIIAILLFRFGRRNIRIGVLVGILVIIFGGFVINQNSFTYLSESFNLEQANRVNANAIARLNLSERLYSLAGKNIWLGFGPGTIQKAAIGGTVSYNSMFEGLGGQENQYMAILADTGVLGFLAYMAFVFLWMKFLMKNSHEMHHDLETYKKVLAVISLCFFIGSLTVSNLTSIAMFFLFILSGAFLGGSARMKDNDQEIASWTADYPTELLEGRG